MSNLGLSKQNAEEIAILALGYLSQDIELMGRFLNLSGLDPSQLRDVAQEPSFMAGLLDFLLSDEANLLAFSANHGLNPEDIAKAKAVLDPMALAQTGAL